MLANADDNSNNVECKELTFPVNSMRQFIGQVHTTATYRERQPNKAKSFAIYAMSFLFRLHTMNRKRKSVSFVVLSSETWVSEWSATTVMYFIFSFHMCGEFTIGVENGNVLEFIIIQYRIGTRKRAWAAFSLLFQFFPFPNGKLHFHLAHMNCLPPPPPTTQPIAVVVWLSATP